MTLHHIYSLVDFPSMQQENSSIYHTIDGNGGVSGRETFAAASGCDTAAADANSERLDACMGWWSLLSGKNGYGQVVCFPLSLT